MLCFLKQIEFPYESFLFFYLFYFFFLTSVAYGRKRTEKYFTFVDIYFLALLLAYRSLKFGVDRRSGPHRYEIDFLGWNTI